MSNYMENQIRDLLSLINWSSQTWEAVTFKMLEGGNQVIEKTPDFSLVIPPQPESKETRICGNLDSENLAQFIAQAPSTLLNAKIRIDKMKKEHEEELYEANRKAEDWKQKYEILKGIVENQTNQITKLQKKLARYEKKRKKEGKK